MYYYDYNSYYYSVRSTIHFFFLENEKLFSPLKGGRRL